MTLTKGFVEMFLKFAFGIEFQLVRVLATDDDYFQYESIEAPCMHECMQTMPTTDNIECQL
jgi:hypothetical protein